MKSKPLRNMLLAALAALLWMIPAYSPAQTEQSSTGLPPIEQQLVREGHLAVELFYALGLGDISDEVEAESRLAELGIAPKNGWIADYPVTPDIAGELRQAVFVAADGGKLSLDRSSALMAFDDVLAGLGLPVVPHTGKTASEIAPQPAESYVDPGVVNNYYYSDGPPVVTYYPPPPTHTSLYSWVPYPFWTSGLLFDGFFVLHDFHRKVVVHKRPFFVTNHFKHPRTHRIFRIDPRARFKGHLNGHSFIDQQRRHPSRVFGSGRDRGHDNRFFDSHRPRSLHHGKPHGFHSRDDKGSRQPRRVFGRSTRESGIDNRHHFDRPRTFNKPSRGFGKDSGRHFDRKRVFSPSSREIRNSGRHSGGRSFNKPSSRGGRSFHGGRGRR